MAPTRYIEPLRAIPGYKLVKGQIRQTGHPRAHAQGTGGRSNPRDGDPSMLTLRDLRRMTDARFLQWLDEICVPTGPVCYFGAIPVAPMIEAEPQEVAA